MNSNEKIKKALKAAGLRQWQLADLMGIHERTLIGKLRHPLPPSEEARIISLINSARETMNNEKAKT